VHDFIADLRYALRMMGKSPGFAAIAVLSLGLGIGANTAIFSLIDAVMLKMLPVRDPQQLYVVARNAARPMVSWNYPDYEAMRQRNTGFSGLVAYDYGGPYGWSLASARGSAAAVAQGTMVSGNYFEVLGVQPALGRVLNREDDRAPGVGPYAVLSHDFWRRQFGMDTQVVGQKVRVNGYPVTIVGVAREGFTGAIVGTAPDFFVPLMMRTELTGRANWNNRNHWWLNVLGRLKPGASLKQLESELFVINQQQEAENRRTATDQRFVNKAEAIAILPGAQGYSQLRNRMSQPLIVLMIVVGAVLLIACGNVANLLLAKAAARQHEIGVRMALGASRGRLAKQLLTESLLLSVMGGVVGLVFAYFGAHMLLRFLPQGGWNVVTLDVSPDLRLLAFTIGLSCLTGILFGLAPVFQSVRGSLASSLREETGSTATRSRFYLRKGLVVMQVALSLLLLIGSGMFVRSLRNLNELQTGFHKDNLLLVDIDPSRNGYKGQRLRDYYENLRARVSALPGVKSVALAAITPLSGSRWNQHVSFPGYQPKEKERMVIDQNGVGPRFFETIGIPVVLGRDLRDEDNPAVVLEPDFGPPPAKPDPARLAGPRYVVINETVAKKYFADQNPIGKRLSISMTYEPESSFEIVGVVKDARYFGLRENTEGMIYQAVWRPGAQPKTLCVRTTGDAEAMLEAIRKEANALDSAVPVLRARTMEQQFETMIVQERLIALLSAFFGGLALLLAAMGLYGVVAHAVARRTREIAIRMALGAERGAVLWLVLRDALAMVLLGAAIAIPAAMVVTKFAEAFLYGISPRDPLTTIAAAILLLVIAGVASWLPARRASAVDPNVALRFE